ncbi:hypothetical protein [Streptomyces sp. KR80]|uniref:hypothetical protein n=1 Tax=Streptomyces sp. KR80 TaxID=3457426 RepID=UPI003FD3F2DD
MPTEPTPRREVVTGVPRQSRARLSGYPPRSEIDEQTTLGTAYVRSLMRSQLRTALTAFAALALLIGPLPLFFALLDSGAGPVWLILGFAVHPLLIALAWWYVRRAERNEQDFARLVEGH